MVREAIKEDLAELLQLYLSLHEQSLPELTEHFHSTWNQIVEDANHHVIVNIIDNQIVSSCVCVIIPNLTRSARPYALIENVVTNSHYRGKGYATECLSFARNIAIQQNCYKMMLLSGSKEQETIRFYQNAGYNCTDKTGFVQWIDI